MDAPQSSRVRSSGLVPLRELTGHDARDPFGGRRARARAAGERLEARPRGAGGRRTGRGRALASRSRRRTQLIQRRTRVAKDRKIVMPSTSCSAVSNGPAVIAGSNPSRLESIGIIVPAKPDRFTEANIEKATTSANVAECQSHATEPTTSAHIPPRMLEV